MSKQTRKNHPTMKKTLIALCALLPLASCVNTSTTVLDPSAKMAPAVAPETVKIYLTPADVPPGSKKLATISARGDNAWTTSDTMFRQIRKDAAKIGANAVLVNQVKEPSAGAQIAGAFLGYSAQRQGQFVAPRTP